MLFNSGARFAFKFQELIAQAAAKVLREADKRMHGLLENRKRPRPAGKKTGKKSGKRTGKKSGKRSAARAKAGADGGGPELRQRRPVEREERSTLNEVQAILAASDLASALDSVEVVTLPGQEHQNWGKPM